VIVSATLDNVRDGLAVDLQVGGKVPAEVRHSDNDETAIWLSSGVGYRGCREEDENQNKSADVAG